MHALLRYLLTCCLTIQYTNASILMDICHMIQCYPVSLGFSPAFVLNRDKCQPTVSKHWKMFNIEHWASFFLHPPVDFWQRAVVIFMPARQCYYYVAGHLINLLHNTQQLHLSCCCSQSMERASSLSLLTYRQQLKTFLFNSTFDLLINECFVNWTDCVKCPAYVKCHFNYCFLNNNNNNYNNCVLCVIIRPSVLWCCWLGSRKGIRPVKNWVVGCWRGYLSGMRCRLAYGPADATATHCLLLQ